MKKYISLVVLGGLFAAASLNADNEGTNPTLTDAATGSQSAKPPVTDPVKSDVSGDGKGVEGGDANKTAPTNKEEVLSKFSIQAIRTFVAAHPYELAGTAAVVVVGLALWKCPWVRRQLGLENEDADLRNQEFDFEALVKSPRK